MGLNGIPSSCIFGKLYMCGCLLQCWVSCLYFICGMRSLFSLRICDSFLSVFRVEVFFTLQQSSLPFKSANLMEIFHPIYIALQLSVGRIMILSSSFSDLMASLSTFEMFGFGAFDFLSICLTFYLCSSVWPTGIFKAASLIGAIKSK